MLLGPWGAQCGPSVPLPQPAAVQESVCIPSFLYLSDICFFASGPWLNTSILTENEVNMVRALADLRDQQRRDNKQSVTHTQVFVR